MLTDSEVCQVSLGEEEGAPSYRIYRVRRVENEHIEPVLRSSVQVTFSHFEIENMRMALPTIMFFIFYMTIWVSVQMLVFTI